jgi:ABC-2 type transport system permease protein
VALQPHVIRAIVAKDLRMFIRDRFYVLISVLGLVLFGALYFVLPATTEETIPVGVHLPGGEQLLEAALAESGEEGLSLTVYATTEALTDAVADGGEIAAGLDFPEGFLVDAAGGTPTTVRVLLSGDAPEPLRPALTAAVREIAFALGGHEPPVALPDVEEMVLGEDRAGDPVTAREQLRPLLVLIVLLMEMFALASLVAVEISQRTVVAVLATPARAADVLAAKAVLGTSLAFCQALLIGLVVGAFGGATAPVVLLALLLGALLVTGVGLIAGATGGDFVAVVFWCMLFFIPLAIPAFGVLFPGAPTLWVQVLPSYGLVEILSRGTAAGASAVELIPYLVPLAAWVAVALLVGTVVLRHRVRWV